MVLSWPFWTLFKLQPALLIGLTQSYLIPSKMPWNSKMPQFPVFRYALFLSYPSTLFSLNPYQTSNDNAICLLDAKVLFVQFFITLKGAVSQNILYVELTERETCSNPLFSSMQNVPIFLYSKNVLFNHIAIYKNLTCISQKICISSHYFQKLGCTWYIDFHETHSF